MKIKRIQGSDPEETALPDCRSRQESKASHIRYIASGRLSSISFIFHSLPVFLSLSRVSPLSSSTSTSRFPTQNVVSERTIPLSLLRRPARRVLFSRKPVNARVGRRMLWKSVLPGNSSGEKKQCRVIHKKMQHIDIVERSFDVS